MLAVVDLSKFSRAIYKILYNSRYRLGANFIQHISERLLCPKVKRLKLNGLIFTYANDTTIFLKDNTWDVLKTKFEENLRKLVQLQLLTRHREFQ